MSSSSASADLLSLLFAGAAPASASTSSVQEQPKVQDGVKQSNGEVKQSSSSVNANQSASNALLAMLNQSSSSSIANPHQPASSSSISIEQPSQSIPSSSSPSLPTPVQAPRKESPFHFFSPFDALTANLGGSGSGNRSVTSPIAGNTTTASAKNGSGSGLRTVSMSNSNTNSDLPPLPKSPEPVKEETAISSGSILDLLNRAAQAHRDGTPQPTLQIQEEEVTEQAEEAEAEEEILPGTIDEDASVDRAHEHLADGVTEQTQNGLTLLPSSSSSDPQVINIDLSSDNEDLLTKHESQHQPISRFKSLPAYTPGSQIAANGLIAYSTRAGRIRVIDPVSGARLIKKVHAGLANDMAISDPFSSESDGKKLKRRLASTVTGHLSVWEIPASFDQDETPSEIHLSIQGPDITFFSVKYSPADPNILACAASIGKILLINLEEARGKTSLSNINISQDYVEVDGTLVSFCFSKDGSVLAAITTDNMVHFFSIPSCQSIGTTLLPSTAQPISEVALLSSPTTNRPAALAVGTGQGNAVYIYDLRDLSTPVASVRLDDSNAKSENGNFGHLTSIPSKGAFSLSSSRAQSVFLLFLSDAQTIPSTETFLSDALALRWIFENSSSNSTESIKLDRVVQVKLTDPVIQTCYDTVEDGKQSLFYLHAEGFEQLITNDAIWSAEDEETAGQAQAETKAGGAEEEDLPEIKQETPAPPSFEEERQPVPTRSPLPSPLPKVELDITDAPSISQTPGPVIEARKAEAQSLIEQADLHANASPQEESMDEEDRLQQLSNLREADASPLPSHRAQAASLLRAPSPSSLAEPLAASTSSSQNPAALASQMQGLFVDQAQLFQNMLLTQQQAEKARFEQMLHFMSNTVTGETQKMIEQTLQKQVADTIKSEVEGKLLPEVLRAFNDLTRAVDSAAQSQAFAVKQTTIQQVRGSIIESLSEQLPQHFQNISNQLPNIVAPAVDACVQKAFLPHFERLENLIRITVADQANTVNSIRAIILNEQMKREENTSRLEAELGAMKREMGELLQRQHQENQALLRQLGQQSSLPQAQGSLPTANGTSTIAEESLIGDEAVPTPPIPDSLRPATPPETYEDLFLRVLKNDPKPLVTLIDEAPFHRLTAVLPEGGLPRISGPNILAICLYIAREFNNGETELGPIGKKRLAWLFSAIQASDVIKRDSRYKIYLPRVYTDVLHGLSERRKILTVVEDIEQIGAVLAVVDEMAANMDE